MGDTLFQAHRWHFSPRFGVTAFDDSLSYRHPFDHVLDLHGLFNESPNKQFTEIYIMYTIFNLFKANIFFRKGLTYLNPAVPPAYARVPAHPSYLKVAGVIVMS
jgi:hypothetical protein